MRRKPGGLVPLEIAICDCALELKSRDVGEFHGYEIAKRLGDATDSRLLTAYGTLYRALGRLEVMGLLASRWEDPNLAARESRPGRRLYRLTDAGEAAVHDTRAAAEAQASAVRGRRRKVAPA